MNAAEVFAKIDMWRRSEDEVKLELLIMLFSNPAIFLSEIPADWTHCVHVDMGPGLGWLDPEREIRPALNNLVGHMAATGRHPIDYCAVKSDDARSIVIRTAA